jgi:hypothetical protein
VEEVSPSTATELKAKIPSGQVGANHTEGGITQKPFKTTPFFFAANMIIAMLASR